MTSDLDIITHLGTDILSYYHDSIEFSTARPDYSCQCLRKAAELLSEKISRHAGIKFKKTNLEYRIELLFQQNVIDNETRIHFHELRKICNAGVHISTSIQDYNFDNHVLSSADITNKQVTATQNAIEHFMHVSIFILNKINPDIDIKNYTITTSENQKNKDILYNACIKHDFEPKLKAGLIYQSMADNMCRIDYSENSEYSYTKKGLICSEDEHRHFTYLYELAAESFDAACHISAWSKHKQRNDYFLIERDEAAIQFCCDIEPLYRYGALTAEGRLGEEKANLGMQRLRRAAERGHIEAAAMYGAVSYNRDDYDSAYKYLTQAACNDDVLSLRFLYLYFSEGKATKPSPDKAKECILRAIELGCPEALAYWGIAHFKGTIAPKSKSTGNELLKEAESRGSTTAAQHYFEKKFKPKLQSLLVNTAKEIKSIFPNEIPAAGSKKTGRNSPCPCGSGKKYKKCCFMHDIHHE